MKTIIIWDVPIRIFHWAFAFCCIGALAVASFSDEDSAIFSLHILMGIAACFFLVLRLVLGVFGCRHNRFKAMFFSPVETLRYMIGIITGAAPRYIVHNPGTSAAAMGMFLLVPLLFWTGHVSAGEGGKDIHEFLAHILLALIVAHLAGMAIHTFRHRENVALSMITGLKQGPAEQGLRSSHPVIGVILLVVSVLSMISLFAGYNAAKRTVTVPLFGHTIQMVEDQQNLHHKSGEGDD
jgi:cytochrome b